MKIGLSLVPERNGRRNHRYGQAGRAIIFTFLLLLGLLGLSLGFREYRQQQVLHVLHFFTKQLDAETEWMHRPIGTVTRGPYVDRVVTEHVPGGSLASCKARTRRDSSESLSRCRAGYEDTRIVREYL